MFGLRHEHQREDRDHYINFDCRVLDDYDQTVQKLAAQTQYTLAQVCTSQRIAGIIGSQATDYVKGFDEYGPRSQTVNGKGFDFDSIMWVAKFFLI